MHALIIREPWISLILDGRKTWEMRTTPTARRGRVALIRAGTGLVVGTAEIVDSLPPVDADTLAATRHLHGIPADQDADVVGRGWVHPWLLREVRRLSIPVPSGQVAGQVIWVPLDPATAARVREQEGAVPAPPPGPVGAVPVGAVPVVAVPAVRAVPEAGPRFRPVAAGNADMVTVVLTKGAIDNANLSVRTARHLLPDGVVGGPNRETAAHDRVTVVFDPGATVDTDVPADKMTLRCRGEVRDFFRRSGVQPGGMVRIRRDGGSLRVELVQ